MARPPAHRKFVQRAEAALVAAIEIYNKPQFPYRDDTFAILAVNAWELLLKAKVIANNSNDERSLFVREPRFNKNGQKSKKLYLKKSRSGNPMTIGLQNAIAMLDTDAHSRLPNAVKANITALVEIRDNAVHYINASTLLSKQTLEIGTATIKNFLGLGRSWFGMDFSQYKLSLMPLGFLDDASIVHGLVVSPEEKRIFDYISGLIAAERVTKASEYHVSMRVAIRFDRTANDASIVVSSKPADGATPIIIDEDIALAAYPWDYKELSIRCRNRYIDFKQDAQYHALRKRLAANPKLAKTRFLDPSRAKGISKTYYNPNILAEFDKHYRLKPSTKPNKQRKG